ncbi:MAG: AAA family ATPase [Gemmatimonadetes bacterium]|nr:AAA family ATPase [Gemmatimonadota bacterium]MBK7785096.1 AAA family ATPase [Gemmatimonadota bacterium]
MITLHLENVRTFAGAHEIALAPLTIITGENSTGKSTILASLASALDGETFPFAPSFNRPPFNLGTFDTIATSKGGRRSAYFRVGVSSDIQRPREPAAVLATYRGREGLVELDSVEIAAKERHVNIRMAPTDGTFHRGVVSVRRPGLEMSQPFRIPRRQVESRSITPYDLATAIRFATQDDDANDVHLLVNEIFSMGWAISAGQVVPLAPIRSTPQRTYGTLTDAFEPTGDHIPFMIERLLSRREESREGRTLARALLRFGKDSGLFDEITVRHLGRKATDPFQILVNHGTRASNLIDVGYGVSQALPLVVQSVLTARKGLLLLQQPEVHLHPRAQAALGSFFASLAGDGNRQFVIETHSDFVIDRIRLSVAKGSLPPDSVAILFLERTGQETVVHRLTLDVHGNIVDAPTSYKAFFLQEELTLLSRTDEDK